MTEIFKYDHQLDTLNTYLLESNEDTHLINGYDEKELFENKMKYCSNEMSSQKQNEIIQQDANTSNLMIMATNYTDAYNSPIKPRLLGSNNREFNVQTLDDDPEFKDPFQSPKSSISPKSWSHFNAVNCDPSFEGFASISQQKENPIDNMFCDSLIGH